MKKQISVIAVLAAVLMLGIMLTSFTSGRSESDISSTESGYLMVRTIETTGWWGSKIIVLHEDGKSETFSLKTLATGNLEENVTRIHAKLNEIKKLGYTMVSSNGGSSDNGMVNTYIFEKK